MFKVIKNKLPAVFGLLNFVSLIATIDSYDNFYEQVIMTTLLLIGALFWFHRYEVLNIKKKGDYYWN